jgi:hypothetical protein
MTDDSKDRKGGDSKAPSEEPPQKPEKRSGRVAFDSRGNSVWEWQLETGVYSRDVSTQKLKKLDLGDLSIAETVVEPGPLSLQDEAPGGGFNPYDRAPNPKQAGFNPYDNARAVGNKFAPQESAKKPRTLDDLRKLSEMIKKQRAMKKGN